ncbi:hypothetical protein BOX15_Mlig000340g2, partial [Macrostomum lignano]
LSQTLRSIAPNRRGVLLAAAAVKLSTSSTLRLSSNLPPLASSLYPPISADGRSLSRGPYSRIEPADLLVFADIIGQNHVITDQFEVFAANTDWPRDCRGQGGHVLRPGCAEEVSVILRHCQKRRIAVVPQGGNTGLAGGGVPVFDELVLSLSRMNRVLEIDAVAGTVVAEAGCVLADLDSHLSEHGLTVPLDLAAKGSCQIGGNLSTNAGGICVLRYGSLRGSVRGLEVALANGELIDCGRVNEHESRLVQLMIGSEGTLGVLTKVTLACPPRPANVRLVLIGCDSFQSVLHLFSAARSTLAETLSAFEIMDAATMSAVSDNLKLNCPLSGSSEFFALVETASCNASGSNDAGKLDRFLECLVSLNHESAGSIDAVISNDSRQFGVIWALRERAFEALVADCGPAGGYMQFDASVSDRLDMQRLVLATRAEFGQLDCVIRVAGFGHLGDGNLHLVVTADPAGAAGCGLWPRVEAFVYGWLSRRRGSISAEHGLGWKRSAYLGHCKSPTAVSVMAGIKRLLDPQGILNPYKVLPPSALSY